MPDCLMPDCWGSSLNQNKCCDICGSDKDVIHEMVEVEQSGCVRRLFSHVQSSLCFICKAKGWIIFGKADVQGGVPYYNLHTREFKHSK